MRYVCPEDGSPLPVGQWVYRLRQSQVFLPLHPLWLHVGDLGRDHDGAFAFHRDPAVRHCRAVDLDAEYLPATTALRFRHSLAHYHHHLYSAGDPDCIIYGGTHVLHNEESNHDRVFAGCQEHIYKGRLHLLPSIIINFSQLRHVWTSF